MEDPETLSMGHGPRSEASSEGKPLGTTEAQSKTSTLLGGAGNVKHLRRDASVLNRGETVGRYVVLEALGSGGMGTVYTAYDPQLDRRIALKLLRERPGGSEGRHREQARLLREAQALAKLNDPHVVTVFDVGSHRGRIFVAMEWIPGSDLTAWLAAEERPLSALIDVFGQAGRGLAAAHAAGLVHRDFKGTNVMVRDDGRVLVLDFGLARSRGRTSDEAAGVAPDTSDDRYVAVDDLTDEGAGQGVLEQPLTITGSVLGTPAYMAPEQRAGAPVNAAADQYSFCLTFYQAVYGEHPIRNASTSTPTWQATVGNDHRVPASLRRLLLRGLAWDPDDRYPSMDALLRDLANDSRRRKRRLAGAVVLGALLAVLAVWFWRQEPGPCGAAAEQFAGVWDANRSERLGQAFLGTGLSYSSDVLATTQASLDSYRDAWVAMHTDTCRATHVRGEQSSALLDRRMDCLDQRRQEASALVDLLTEQPQLTIERAVRAVAGLRPLTTCSDTTALMSTLPLPSSEAQRARVEALRSELAKARALLVAGQYRAGEVMTVPLLEEAESLGYWPVTAEALRRLGGAQESSGHPKAARISYGRAVYAAQVGHHDRVAAESLVRLVRVTGYQLADFESSHFFADLAGGLLLQLPGSRDLEALLADHRGVLALQEGAPSVAFQHHLDALRILEDLRGKDHPDIARSLIRLSNVLVMEGDSLTARDYLQRALEIVLSALGPSHPDVAAVRERLGGAAIDLGMLDLARDQLELAAQVQMDALGGDHPKLASTLLSLGQVDTLEGQHAAALKRFRMAYEIYAGRFGADHPHVAVAASNIGSSWAEQEEFDLARQALNEALEIQTATYGDDHPWVASTLHNLADVASREERFESAEPLHRRALEIWGRQGEDHPHVAIGSCGLGRTLHGQGRDREAIPFLRRGVEIAAAAGDASVLAECRFALARSLRSSGGTEDEIRRLSDLALSTFEASPLRYARQLEEFRAWRRDAD